MKKRNWMILFCMLIMSVFFTGCSSQDTLEYEGEKYVLLEYPASVFYYDYQYDDSGEFEVEGIYPFKGTQWDMVWVEGDVYCIKDQAKEAAAYYGNDANYEWFVVIDEEDEEVTYPLRLTTEEIESLYAIEEAERDNSIFFEEIETFGSIIKVSKDGFIKAGIGLAQYDGSWYWRTETINEDKEQDGAWAEYICELPETVIEKINDLLK